VYAIPFWFQAKVASELWHWLKSNLMPDSDLAVPDAFSASIATRGRRLIFARTAPVAAAVFDQFSFVKELCSGHGRPPSLFHFYDSTAGNREKYRRRVNKWVYCPHLAYLM
jgi:hypothetical protein